MNIKELITKGESQTTEFKTSLSDIDRIVEEISAFANTNTGKILIGVANNGEIIGVEIGKDTIERLANKITTSIDPKIYPRIEIVSGGNKNIIVIEVKEGMHKPYLAFGKGFKRIGKSTVHLSRDEFEKIILEKHKEKILFDNIIRDATVEDIDEEKVRWYLDRRERIRKIPAELDLKTLLININSAKEVDGKIKLTNAGILFFTKNPHRFIPAARILAVRFEGVKISRTTIDSLDTSGTLWEMLEQIEDFVRKHIRLFGFRTPFSFRRIDKWNIQ
jgi:ATP-dependent DNA helicase RecG